MKLTQREKDLGYCEEANTYCSVAEEAYQQGRADEQIQSIEDAKQQATEYLDALDKAKKEAYQQGRANVITELLETKNYDELSQKIAIDILERGIAKGRADAIEKYHLKLLNCKTDKVKSIHDAEIWVEFKRQSTRIAEQLKGAEE